MPTPMDIEVENNDVVTNYQQQKLFEGQPIDVFTYLSQPGNVGDTTQCIYSPQTAEPWASTLCYATEYMANFATVYPDVDTSGVVIGS
jgi:hypothetical protein